MNLHHQDNTTKVIHGDCIETMNQMEPETISAIVTDPPYGLGFMGKKWDNLPPSKEWAEACYRVLKPGGHIAAFGGTRTWHRLAVAIEDAGFEMRDSLAWLYGSGFPKSHDVSKGIDKLAGAEREVVGVHYRHGGGKETSGSMSGPLGTASELPLTAPATPEAAQWDGWGTALKPAFEPIVLARKPFPGTVAANVLEHGTGAINVDGCRIGMSDEDRESARVPSRDKHGYGNLHDGAGRSGTRFEPAPVWSLACERCSRPARRRMGRRTKREPPVVRRVRRGWIAGPRRPCHGVPGRQQALGHVRRQWWRVSLLLHGEGTETRTAKR